jgi:predicted RND superfamily exporter protein
MGVGIDYSIHMTQRFREEMESASGKTEALRKSARGTGLALMTSALSSMAGFTIMGFAPFPLISTYGFLTVAMIGLALTASLVVLPSLLMLVTREKVSG